MGLRTILRIRDLAACDTVVRSKFVQMTLTKNPEKISEKVAAQGGSRTLVSVARARNKTGPGK